MQIIKEDLIKYKQIPIGKAKNLTNEKFGRLKPLYRIASDKAGVYWMCQCDCGFYTIVLAQNLIQGKTKSCGCYGKECSKQSMIKMRKKFSEPWNKKDLTGQQFGQWTVIKKDEDNLDIHHTKWICQCSCGNIKSVYGGNLGKISNSCGCNKKSIGEQKIKTILDDNNISYITEYCAFKYSEKRNSYARFDFYIDNKYLIEYDGTTHYVPIGGWNNEEQIKAQQERDMIKNQWFKDNNIPLIRIPYTHYDNLCIEDLKLETSTFIINPEDVKEENNNE